MVTTLLSTAINAVSLATGIVCARGAPHPVGFHSRGFPYVAEVFPPNARRNADSHPRIYVYEAGYPEANWRVDARRLWTAALPVMPRAALVSMAGHVVS